MNRRISKETEYVNKNKLIKSVPVDEEAFQTSQKQLATVLTENNKRIQALSISSILTDLCVKLQEQMPI